MDLHFKADELSLEEKLNALPTRPGVYQFRNQAGRVIYVGKAQNLRSRVRQYFHASRASDPRLDALVSNIADVQLIVTESDVEALILESNLIKRFRPRYNVILKDDKSYPFIVVTNEEFPRVFVTRRIIRDGSKYFGPYTDVKTMRFALKTVRDIFMIRSCNYDMTEETIRQGRYKVCLDYHIKKCEGPCEGFVGKDHYRGMIAHVGQVLRGKTGELEATLRKEMEALSENLQYEDAARIRDKLSALEVYTQKQRVVDSRGEERDIIAVAARRDDACGVVFRVREGKLIGSRHFMMANAGEKAESALLEALLQRYYLDAEDIPRELVLSAPIEEEGIIRRWLSERRDGGVSIEVPKAGDKAKQVALARNNAWYHLEELEIQRLKRGEAVSPAVEALQKDLRLQAPPRRIECFDISNIQGTDTVASMVVFVDGKARKSEYRKFKLKTVDGPDDFASMREVVHRRYERVRNQGGPFPDLVVIDGGKGQLSSAVEVLRALELDALPAIGLAKRLEEVFLRGEKESLLLPRTSLSLRLLQRIRNEAHRFAVTYHRTVRAKRVLSTELDLIKGIGKKRAQELLEVFGSVQGVKFASEEQLADVVGDAVAARIKEHFQPESENENGTLSPNDASV